MASQTAVPDWAAPPVAPAPDWAIAPAIHQQESGGALTAQTSPTGAMGGWQIEPTTFAQYATPGERITNPADNKAVGERIIADLTKRTGGDPARVAVGYVSGPGNIAPANSPTPWIKNPTVGGGSSKRVSDYVAEVVKRLNPVSDAEAAQPAVPDWATPAPAAATPDWATPAAPASATRPETPGFIGSLTGGLFRGAKESLTGVGQTVTGPFADRAQAPAQNDALAQTLAKPFSQGWSDPSWWAAKIGEGIGSSGPTVAGAVLGAAGASAIAPEAPVAAQLAGAALGGAGGNFIQQLAPAYQQGIAEGLTHDQAVDRALKETGIGSAVAGAMSAVPGGRLLGQWAEGTAKRAISEALINIFGVQPAIGAAGQVATAAVENKPLTLDDLLTAYAQNVGMGAAFHVAGAGKRAVDRARAPEDLALPPEAIRPKQPKPTDLAATVPPVTGETPKPGDLLHTMRERGPIVPDEPVNKLGQDVNSASIKAPEAADSLYVNRPVINAQEIHDWAVRNGVPEPVAPADMHATQVYSRKAAPLEPLRDEIVAGPTRVAPIGDQGAVALHINSPEMQARFAEAKAAGATHDYPEFQPHVTLSYNAPGFDASKIAEPMPAVRLGPEIHAPLDEAKAAAAMGRAPATPDWATPRPAEPIAPDTIDVYHGSPHQFEQFDTSKIGTGEGAQSFGHGIYLAESPDVAETYREFAPPAAIATIDKYTKTAGGDALRASSAMIDDAQPLIQKQKAGTITPEESAQLRALSYAITRDKGNIYKSQILGRPDEFLDWDRPLSEQPKMIAVLRANGFKDAPFPHSGLVGPGPKAPLTGNNIGDAYKVLSRELGSQQHASNALTLSGIKGIRYLDAKSRDVPAMGKSLRNDIQDYTAQAAVKDAAGDTVGANFLRDKIAQRQKMLDSLKPPTRNYVVFDAKHAVPIERNGTPIQRVLPGSTAETVKAVNPGEVADGIKQASFDIGEALEPGGRGGGGQKPPAGGAPPAGGDGGGKRRGLMQSAARMEGIVNAMPNDPLSINRMSWIAKHGALAQGLASADRTSADYLTALLDRQAARHSLTTEGANGQRDYGRLSDKDRLPIDKVLEWDRMTGTEAGATGNRTMVADAAAFRGRPWPLQLTKPGETVRLNAEQSRILGNLRSFLDQAWKQHAEAQARRFGYDGPFLTKDADGKFQIDLPAIKAEFDNATDRGLRKAAERALGIATAAAEGGRGGSYFPLMRYGDWSIRVRPKKPISGTGHPLPSEGWVSLVQTGNAFDSLKGIVKTEHGNTPPRKVLEEVARLRQRFPAADFHMEINKPSPRLREVVDMPMLERVLADTKLTDPATGEKLKDEVIEKLYQQMLAGFRKPSDNVPGYSTDFPRAIGDYVRQWAGSTANALHSRNVDDSYLATQLHRDPNVARYWRNHKTYNEGDESRVWSAARRLAFFKYLWGSPTSALMQLAQTPFVTGMQLSGIIGLRGQAMVHTALARVGAALRADAREGVKLDIAKIPGITAAERAGLMQADKEGRLNPSLPKDLAGGTLSDAMRKRFPAATRIYDIGSSMFNTADRMNRIAAWLAYHRAAQLPGAAERFNKAYAKDALFQQQVGRDLDPVKLANWASDETQFLSGRMGSAPVMRGAGSALFQFQHYNANYLRLLHKNFTRMGPQGKVAGTMMLLGLAGAAGLGGLPFVSDLERLANDGIQLATGIDPRLDAQLREFINDTGFAKMMDGYMGWTPGQTGEVIMEGPTRLTGLDLGRRIGLGNLLPQSTDIYQGVPFLSATLGAAMEAANRYKSGQPIGAAAALLPAGIGNPLKGYGVYPNEGVRQQRGQMVFPPSEVTPAMQATRALGATPTPIARRQQAMADQSAIKYATDEAAKNLLARIAGEFTLAEDAQKQGDTAGAAAHTQAATDYIQANAERLANADVPDWQQIPTPRAAQIRKTIARYLFPVQGTAARNQRMKQEELSASPYLTQ